MPKGRKPNKSANTVFTGVVRRNVSNPTTAFLEVQYNDADGVRRIQKLVLQVVNGAVQAVPTEGSAPPVPTVVVEAEETVGVV